MAVKVPILTYHKISPVDKQSIYPGTFVPPALFEKHLRHLARSGFETMPLVSLFGDSMPAKPIVLTFDDGFQDYSTTAYPALQRYGFNGTVFLVADLLGQQNEWDMKIGDVGYPLMSVDTIRRLHEGGTEFGSHTRTHSRLTSDTDAHQEEEIVDSQTVLERELGFPIETFCYPYGSYNETSVNLARKAGYKFATTCEKGLNDGSEDPLKLKRIAVRHDTSQPVFVYKLWRAFRLGR